MSYAGHFQGYVWNKTGYSRGTVETLAGVSTLPSPKIGETVFCDDFIKSINGTITTRVQGDAMVFDSTVGSAKRVIQPTTTGDPKFAGIVAFSAAAGAPIALAYKGVYKTRIALFSDSYFNSLWAPIRTTSLNGGMETIAGYIGPAAGHCGWLIQRPSSSTPGLFKCLLRGKTEHYF
jgi:hypothetical protein